MNPLRNLQNGTSAGEQDDISEANPLFVYIMVPADLDPEERHERFGDPLHEALEKANLGAVTGGGTQFSEPDENGDDHVEFSGIDVDLYQVERGLALLRKELVRLKIPQGTVLCYRLNGQERQDPVYPSTFS